MHITVTTLPGYTPVEKKLLAKKLKEAAASAGVVSFTVSVSIKDLPMKEWDKFVRELPDNEIIIPELRKGYEDY
ncbi:hypothetical protein [uncultured Alistipes sp.]|uniref:hypothetical protein n=1 Tax=uncultured Alistipes sp. TaxID=538949 RepID=UPI00320B5E2B